MNIAMILASLPSSGKKPGGVDIAIHRLANTLVMMGQSVVVLSPCDKPADALYEHLQIFPWMKDKVDSKIMRLLLFPLLLNFLNFSRFDVLHLNGDDWFFIWRTKPSVRVLHGSALREAQFATSSKRKWLQYFIYPLELLSSKLATRVVAGGEDAAKIYKSNYLVDYGVDLSIFTRKAKHDFPSVFYVGTWRGRKRGKFLFDIFVNEVLPAKNDAILCMACDYVPDHPQVINLGFPSDAELARHMAEAWIFAYPSTYEGFGIPYVEAMACGTTILTTSNPGSEYLLRNGETGLIVEDDQFGTSLLSLLNDARYRKLLAKNAASGIARFTWDHVAKNYIQIYEDTIRSF